MAVREECSDCSFWVYQREPLRQKGARWRACSRGLLAFCAAFHWLTDTHPFSLRLEHLQHGMVARAADTYAEAVA